MSEPTEPSICSADALRARTDSPQARRVGRLQALSLAAQVSGAVGFTLAFAGALPPARGVLTGVVAGAVVFAGWLVLRAHVPAAVPQSELQPEPLDSGGDDRATLRDLPWLAVTHVVVGAYLVLALLAVHWLLVLVAAGVALGVGGMSVGGFAMAVGSSLVVCAAVELGIEQPLMRRWGIPR